MSVDPTFTEQWYREAHLEFEQQESRLRPMVNETRFTGKTYHWPVYENESAIAGKARHADVNIITQVTKDVSATVEPIYAAYMIDDWDAARSSVDYRSVINKKAAGAIWRKYDDLVIDALNTGQTTETTLADANQFSYNSAVSVAEVLDLNDVPSDMRYGLLSPGGCTDIQQDTTYINNFHNQNQIVRGGSQVIPGVAGIDYVKTTRLPNGDAGATERRGFAWQKMALGVALAQDFRVTVDWVPEKQGYLFVASMVMAAKVFDDTGVVAFDVAN